MEEVSFEDYRKMMRGYERKERRLWIMILIGLVAFGGSNLFWIVRFFG